jgi:diguanylate cyclase (GGDEF)-like protein
MNEQALTPSSLVIDPKSQAFAVQLMRDLVVPTFVIDAAGRVLIWNNALAKLTGVSATEVVGTTDHWRGFYSKKRPCVADLVLSGDYRLNDLYEEVVSLSHRERSISAENWCQFPRTNEPRYLAIDAGPIYSVCGKLIAVVETIRDITEQKKTEAELLRLASVDGLTGIANRRSFDHCIEDNWLKAQAQNSQLSLLIIDIDHFKKYNDFYGHQAGDDCLCRLASLFGRVTVYPEDFVARYGGEEFAIILPKTGIDGAVSLANRILFEVDSLALPHDKSPVSQHVTISIGAASMIENTTSFADLIATADSALYLAKRDGRNKLKVAP